MACECRKRWTRRGNMILAQGLFLLALASIFWAALARRGPAASMSETPPQDVPSLPRGPESSGPVAIEPLYETRDPAADKAARTLLRGGTEKAYEREFRETARHRPDRLMSDIEATLAGEHPDAQKVAALRAAYEVGRLDPFLRVLASEAESQALRSFALRFLAGKSPRTPSARALLADYVRMRPPEEEQRRDALAALLRWAPDRELAGYWDLLTFETAPGAAIGAAVALRKNGNNPTAAAALQYLATAHPSAEVRHRAAEERSGRYCPEHAQEAADPEGGY
ncbi:MAG: hypothetical protein HY716_08385 [Planctomycetes bacterium]|nr:hypothetical protein [Planctomycetota bacterium]